jgi:hypothetical protein
VVVISVVSGSTKASSVAITASAAVQNPNAAATASGAGKVSSNGPKPSAEAVDSASSSATTSATTVPKKSNHTGAIAGGVVGGVIVIALIVGFIYFFLRKKKTSAKQQNLELSKPRPDSSVHPSHLVELYAPITKEKWSQGSSSELSVPPQYYPQQHELNSESLVELQSNVPGPRASHYAPGQQTRPQYEMSDANYSD